LRKGSTEWTFISDIIIEKHYEEIHENDQVEDRKETTSISTRK